MNRIDVLECRACHARTWTIDQAAPPVPVAGEQEGCWFRGIRPGDDEHDWWARFTFTVQDNGPGLHPTLRGYIDETRPLNEQRGEVRS